MTNFAESLVTEEPGINERFQRTPLPPSDAPTAVPVFLGFTETKKNGKCYQVESIEKFIESFGKPSNRNPTGYGRALYDAVKHYFDNGGVNCYIYSLAQNEPEPDEAGVVPSSATIGRDQIARLLTPELIDKVLDDASDATLLSVPVLGAEGDCHSPARADQEAGGSTAESAAESAARLAAELAAGLAADSWAACWSRLLTAAASRKNRNLFLLIDLPGEAEAAVQCMDALRKVTSADQQGRAACYWPHLKSAYSRRGISHAPESRCVVPSGAVAAIIQAADRESGIWTAPANFALANTIQPAYEESQGAALFDRIDTGRLSVNRIRSFPGRGVRIWGCRTLLPAGKISGRSYVQTARFVSYVEEALGNISRFAVFEPNHEITWIKLKSLLRAWLRRHWQLGALVGANEMDAFAIEVGVGETMTQTDVLAGRLIIKIKLALHAPTEFIELLVSLQTGDSRAAGASAFPKA